MEITVTKLLLSSFWCLGVYCIFSPPYILGRFGDFLRFIFPRWIAKPLFDCPPCMASIHGIAIHYITGGSHEMVIHFIVCLCGLNYFATQFFNE